MLNSFTNEVSINSSKARVKEILLNSENLKKWDPEVALVEKKANNTSHLVRRGPAINSSEYLSVESHEDVIIYHSFGGTVEYSITFKMSEKNDNTEVQQIVDITNISEYVLKVDRLVAIVKSAFNENLQNLKQVCEEQVKKHESASQSDFDEFTANREKIKKVDKFFFENNINIHASKKTLFDLLVNIDRIIEWDHDINNVQKDENGFRVIRTTPAINEFEHIEISRQNDDIVYSSTEGLVEYRIIFTITELENSDSHLTENVTLTGYPSFPIPFSVFQPITQNAFQQVLEVLKSVAEVEELKTK